MAESAEQSMTPQEAKNHRQRSERIAQGMVESLNWVSENPAMADWIANPQNAPLTDAERREALEYYRKHGEPPPNKPPLHER